MKHQTTFRRHGITTIAATFMLLIASAAAQVPTTMSFQGVLGSGVGANSSQSLTFRIYTSSSGGTAIWSETQTVTLKDRVFNVVLGSSSTLDILFNQQYWIGVTVGSGTELTPRIQLTSASYSMNTARIGGRVVANMSSAPSDGQVLKWNSSAGQWEAGSASLSGSAGGDLSGSYPNPTVARLQGRTIASSAPSNGEVLKWNSSASQWEPSTSGVSGSAGGDLSGTYPNPAIAEDAVTTSKIDDGAVTDAKIASGISYSKLSGAPTALPPNGSAGGDLGGSYPNPSVATVGGVTASNVASGAGAANAATSTNTASTIVRRDASGNFSAGTITANLTGDVSGTASTITGTIAQSQVSGLTGDLAAKANDNAVVHLSGSETISDTKTFTSPIVGDITGNAATATTATTAGSFTGSLSGDVTGTQSATSITAGAVTTAKIADGAVTDAKVASGISYSKLNGAPSALPPSGSAGGDLSGSYPDPSVAQVGGITAASVASGATAANSATDASTASTIVRRDASGNFSAGTITANLTGDVSGTASTITGSIAQSQVTDLTGDLAAKANDNAVVHLAGDETIAGAKTFTSQIVGDISGNAGSVTNGVYTSGSYADPSFITSLAGSKITGNIGGNAASITGSIAQSQVTDLTSDLAAKADDNAVVHLTGDETINGTKTFSSPIAGSVTGSAASITGNLTGDVTSSGMTTSIADAAVTTAKINDGAITDAKVASGISYSKLTGAPTSLPPNGAAGGDLSGNYPNPTIASTAGSNVVGAINNGSSTINAARIGNGLTNSQVNNDLTINGGTIDATPIGGTTRSSGAFTTVDAGTSMTVSGSGGELRLQGSGSGRTALKAGAQGTANITYTLPTAAPTSNGQVLSSTTGGAMSWTEMSVASSVPAGYMILGNSATAPTGYTYTGVTMNGNGGTTDISWSTRSSSGFTPRFGPAAAVVNNRIYVMGGRDLSSYLNTVEEYDPATDSWSTKSSSNFTARAYLATVVVNDSIFAIGGYDGNNYLNTNEMYNPATNLWVSRSSSGFTARGQLAAAVVNDKIYAIGGRNSAGYFNTNQEFNPATNTWTTKSSSGFTARAGLAAQVVNSKIYAMGGSNGNALNTNQEYNPANNTWTTKSSSGFSARHFLAAAVVNDKIYAIGGEDGDSYFNTVELYDPANNTWTTKSSIGFSPRRSMAAAVVNDRIYAIGGYNGTPLSTNEEASLQTTYYVHIKQ